MSTVSYEISSGKCPYCSGMRVLQGFNDLATVNPAIAKEWDYEKNDELSPEKITAGSGKKYGGDVKRSFLVCFHCFKKSRKWLPYLCKSYCFKGYNDITSNERLLKSWDFEKIMGWIRQNLALDQRKQYGGFALCVDANGRQ